MHISRLLGFTEAAPPHDTCIMNRCARSCSRRSSDAWRMAEFQRRPRVKSYPLPDPGIRHRCMMSVPMWKGTATPLTRLRPPHGAAIPATAPHEPWTFSSQIPTSNHSIPEELPAFPYSPSPAKVIHLCKEAHHTRRGSNYVSACRSWFHYVLAL